MRKIGRLIAGGLALLCLYLFAIYLRTDGGDTVRETIVLETDAVHSAQPSAAPSEAPEPRQTILPATISGGMVIKNTAGYDIDIDAVVERGCDIRLQAGAPQILIIHTHSTEAYSPAGLDKYDDLGTNRTLDQNCSVIRIGSELAQMLGDCGLEVIHDTQVFDYPSYTGSYNRSCEAIEKYLADYPSIRIVIDLHRDALGSDTVIYKTAATEKGVCAGQIMFVVGTDASGLEHPDWRQNLGLAVYLQNAVCQSYPSLMRPILLTKYRYNQNLTPGSVILEVGTNGNTLREALAAIRLFAQCAGPALAQLVQ